MMLSEALKELGEDTRLARLGWGGVQSPFHLTLTEDDCLDAFAYIGEDAEEVQVLCYTITQTDMLAMDWVVIPIQEK